MEGVWQFPIPLRPCEKGGGGGSSIKGGRPGRFYRIFERQNYCLYIEPVETVTVPLEGWWEAPT